MNAVLIGARALHFAALISVTGVFVFLRFIAEPDVALDPVILLLADHRADLSIRIARITDLHHRDGRFRQSADLGDTILGHEDARSRNTGLAAVPEAGGERERDRLREIGIVKDQRRRLAAEFQRHPLHRLGARAQDRLADGGGPGE